MLCPKCGGTGFIREYGHIASGVCFACNGQGHVASNGKTVRSVKLSQISACLPGFSKRDMKTIIDDSLVGLNYAEFAGSNVWSHECARYAKFALCGLYTVSQHKNSVRFTPKFGRSTFQSLIDWNK